MLTAAEYSLEERARMRDKEELEMIEVHAALQFVIFRALRVLGCTGFEVF